MRSMLRRFGAQHVALIFLVVTLAGLLLGFAGCQGLPGTWLIVLSLQLLQQILPLFHPRPSRRPRLSAAFR